MSPSLFSLRSRLGRVAFLTFFVLVLVACGADRPTPAYPPIPPWRTPTWLNT
ncbi:MAG: hypothetical protein GXP55_18365 [Deltaproteobacteria bacterium]|nr:hypothetical protein [Deltaproteobacteria bacterium]